MTTYVALLRAVNVGGTGKLAMADLAALCTAAGFEAVRTYIASGNVVFRSRAGAGEVKAALESGLLAHVGAPVGVIVRTAAEMEGVLVDDPFPEAPGSGTSVLFLDAPPSPDCLDRVTGRAADEDLRPGRREIYIRYGAAGMGRSRLRIPEAEHGTARNRNTVAALARMAAEMP